MREISVKEGSIYHQYVPIITDLTSIGEFGQPILEYQDVRNGFMADLLSVLLKLKLKVRFTITNLNSLKAKKYHLATLFKIFMLTQPRVVNSTLKTLPVYFRSTKLMLNSNS